MKIQLQSSVMWNKKIYEQKNVFFIYLFLSGKFLEKLNFIFNANTETLVRFPTENIHSIVLVKCQFFFLYLLLVFLKIFIFVPVFISWFP